MKNAANFDNDNPSLCKLRWGYPIVNFGQQAVRQCCRTPIFKVQDHEVRALKENIFLNHPYHIERRKEMLKGQRHKDCESCWNLEDNGMISPRQNFTDFKEIDLVSGDSSIFFKNQSRSKNPWMLDIELSNLCDMACMYCNRIFSSKWAAEDIKLNKISQVQAKEESKGSIPEFETYFWNWFSSIKQNLGHINFIGGEPFLQKKYFECVERINFEYGDRPRKELNFVTVSNFNTPESTFEKLVPLVEKISSLYSVNFDASQESFGARAEFIRYGLSWDTWLKNVNRILSYKFKDFELGIQSAVNLLSLKKLPEFFENIADIRDSHNAIIVLKTNLVSWPTYHSPLIATADFSENLRAAAAIIKKRHNPLLNTKMRGHGSFNWDRYPDFLNNLASSIEDKQTDVKFLKSERSKFYSWVKDYEKTRSVDFLKTFPEYSDFYEVCYQANKELNP